jgi:hypothetical protein
MKKLVVTLATIATLGFGSLAAAHGACRDKHDAKKSARKQLNECVDGWAKDRKPSDIDQSDDCSSKLQGFVQASKDLRACENTEKK